MSDAALAVMAIWLAGTAVLATRWGNDMRKALNNLAPRASFSDYAQTNSFGVSFFLPAPSSRKS